MSMIQKNEIFEAEGVIVSVTVKSITPRDMNGLTPRLTLISTNNRSYILPDEKSTRELKPGSTVTLELRGRFTTLIDVVK